MSGLARLLLYAAALAALFAGAAAVGRAVGPVDPPLQETEGEAGHAEGEEEPMAEEAAEGADGLAVAVPGLRLVADQVGPGPRAVVRFRIEDAQGAPVLDFDTLHERPMHVVLVRRDLAGFQHLHPTASAGGTWTTQADLSEAGDWRLLADFSTGGRRAVLGSDVIVPGELRPSPLPAPASIAAAGPYQVRLHTPALRAGAEQALEFTPTLDGEPVQLQPYLGALGHLVVLREGDLGYLHTHPEDGRASFRTTFPSAGRYRAFLQFKAEDEVRTAAFTLEVDP